ncbi:hypothetical protein B4Q13_19265 [Lacticaseibacillus rhamnosus]
MFRPRAWKHTNAYYVASNSIAAEHQRRGSVHQGADRRIEVRVVFNRLGKIADAFAAERDIRMAGLGVDRYRVACNGRARPVRPTGRVGEFVGAVRYRAWQPGWRTPAPFYDRAGQILAGVGVKP